VPAAGRIRARLAGSGYACAAAVHELDHLMLLVAVRNEAAQAGRGDGDGRASTRLSASTRRFRLRSARVNPLP
jgi:hypothetical protein